MRHPLRRALGAALLAAALVGGAASAEDPATTAAHLAEDTVSGIEADVADLARGCNPVVLNWSPVPFKYTPFTTANGSIYYRETGGGIAHLSCSAAVRIRARVSDDAVPPFGFKRGSYTNTYVTSKDPKDIGTVDVAYFGPDAPVMRPYGHVVVHVEVTRKLANGRYAPLRSGCKEWRYVLQPAASLLVTEPQLVSQGACAYDGAYAATDLVEAVSIQDVPSRL